MSCTTSVNMRPCNGTATTGPPGSRRIVRGAPGRRGGVRNAGTVSPAARVAAPSRRATVAKRTVGARSTRSIQPHGCDTHLVRSSGCDGPRCSGAIRTTGRSGGSRCPAFGALVAEPLYVLADTAIVGRLGTRPLGGLAIAGTVLTSAFGVFNFLAYGTTAAVARRIGARDERAGGGARRRRHLARARARCSLTLLGLALAPWIVDVMGASSRTHAYALTYLRIGLLGAPVMLLALAGTGYLRGLQDTRTPLVIAVAANLFNLALEILFVYGFDWGSPVPRGAR